MHITATCHSCGRRHEAPLAEGRTSARFQCPCGADFAHVILVEPYGQSFLYGEEALERKRPSDACTRFATAFDKFLLQVADVLILRGSEAGALSEKARRRSRRKWLEAVRRELNASGLPLPDLGSRNAAVHQAKVPTTREAHAVRDSVMQSIDAWLKALEALAGPDLRRLLDAYDRPGELPQDVKSFDRRVFDLRTTWRTMQDVDLASGE